MSGTHGATSESGARRWSSANSLPSDSCVPTVSAGSHSQRCTIWRPPHPHPHPHPPHPTHPPTPTHPYTARLHAHDGLAVQDIKVQLQLVPLDKGGDNQRALEAAGCNPFLELTCRCVVRSLGSVLRSVPVDCRKV